MQEVHVAADLTGFVRHLTWSDPLDVCASAWKTEYVQRLEGVVKECAMRDQQLADALRRTGDEDVVAALLCPRVQWAISQTKDQQSIAVELLAELSNRLGQRTGCGSGPPDEQVSIEGFVIDFDSSFELPGMTIRPAPTPSDRRRVECDRIKSAVVELRSAAAAASTFVTDMTTRFAIRGAKDARFWVSGSLTEYPGMILLVNPWHARPDLASMIEVLVHESIHHAIALFEATRHDVIQNVDRRTLHQSPWSGKRLTAHQFVEACFVWWGIYQLWAKWPAVSNVPVERAHALCQRALGGFVAHPVTTLLQSIDRASIAADTVEALRAMEHAAAAEVEAMNVPTATS
jgi:hypothetical protein